MANFVSNKVISPKKLRELLIMTSSIVAMEGCHYWVRLAESNGLSVLNPYPDFTPFD